MASTGVRIAMSVQRLALLLVIGVGLTACAVPRVQQPPKPTLAPVTAPLPIHAARLSAAAGILDPGVLAQLPEQGKAILVNIPSFELIAFEDRRLVLRSRVIVGKPATPTPIWNTATSVVRFRPTWTPTPRMIASGKYRPGTRPAGPRNPLGFLAIRLDPGSLIYLHGTHKPQLYDREVRALSHGCVRVERWSEVAAWVLDIPVEAVLDHAHDGGRTFDMPTNGVPVIMTYLTEFPDVDGVIRQHKDIYRRETYAAKPAPNVL